MRWLWIDRFLEIESGRRAVSIKNVTLVEDVVDGYMPGFPMMPHSLIVEGMAQTGGLLVGEVNDFNERVVLAKVSKAVFHRPALPGDTLTYTATIQDINPQGAIVQGLSHIGDELQGEIDLVFAHLDERFGSEILFRPEDFLTMLRVFGLFDLKSPGGAKPVSEPKTLREAERQVYGS